MGKKPLEMFHNLGYSNLVNTTKEELQPALSTPQKNAVVSVNQSEMTAFFHRKENHMIVLIAGASHTGKTLLAQRILEEFGYPYLCIDHLKMGLIRSGNTELTPMDDDKLTDYLWPIVREMVKTAIENHQNLVVEGCYIPAHWARDFEKEYLEQIRYVCLVMSRDYIERHFNEIRTFGCAIEQRLDDSGLCKDDLIRENEANLRACREQGCRYILLENDYKISLKFLA